MRYKEDELFFGEEYVEEPIKNKNIKCREPSNKEVEYLRNISKDYCKECPMYSCHWNEEYGCAILWYNIYKIEKRNSKRK